MRSTPSLPIAFAYPPEVTVAPWRIVRLALSSGEPNVMCAPRRALVVRPAASNNKMKTQVRACQVELETPGFF